MAEPISPPQAEPGDTRTGILRAIAGTPEGRTVEELAAAVGISRSGVRQQLTVLERDGLVARAATRPSGGRPELQYVLTEAGRESFPRQYSWFSELLLSMLATRLGETGLGRRMEEMGAEVGRGLGVRGLAPDERLSAIIARMRELGYETEAAGNGDVREIEARNCVFHKLAQRHPEICRFDIAMLEESLGAGIEHRTCMARGDRTCRFRIVKDG